MDYFIIGVAAFLTSLLTLFSGFGLGTLLMPVFAIFFPIEAAIACTGIVHFLNNVFKLTLVGRYANWGIVTGFGIPAIAGAFLGALILTLSANLEPIISYSFFERQADITVTKCLVAGLMIGFALFEVVPRLQKITFDQKYLKLGGFLSGFFGGVSGHQGAFRSAFLARRELSKESFIGTGVVIACFVDLTRLSVYSTHMKNVWRSNISSFLICATIAAFLGAWIGNRMIKKVTMKSVQVLVSSFLFLIAILIGFGVI